MSCYGYCEKEEVAWEVFWDGDYSLRMREVIYENGQSEMRWLFAYPHDDESDKQAKDSFEAFKKFWLQNHPPVTSYPMKCKGDCVCEYDDVEELVQKFKYPDFVRYLVAGSNTLTGYINMKFKLKRTIRISSGSCGDNPVGLG